MFVGQGGLGLPDEEYYRLDRYADIRAAYREHVAGSLALAGFADAEAQADAVFELETAIAACHWDKVRTRDLRADVQPDAAGRLRGLRARAAVRTWLDGLGVPRRPSAELVVTQPSFFTDVAACSPRSGSRPGAPGPRGAWSRRARRTCPSAFVQERFGFYGTVLSGTPKLKERWKRGVDLVEGALGEAVGKLYVEQHFSPVAKERMDVLVANLIEAYRRSISELAWMTDETKARALDKLAKFRPQDRLPRASWRDYSHAGDRPPATCSATSRGRPVRAPAHSPRSARRSTARSG